MKLNFLKLKPTLLPQASLSKSFQTRNYNISKLTKVVDRFESWWIKLLATFLTHFTPPIPF